MTDRFLTIVLSFLFSSIFATDALGSSLVAAMLQQHPEPLDSSVRASLDPPLCREQFHSLNSFFLTQVWPDCFTLPGVCSRASWTQVAVKGMSNCGTNPGHSFALVYPNPAPVSKRHLPKVVGTLLCALWRVLSFAV